MRHVTPGKGNRNGGKSWNEENELIIGSKNKRKKIKKIRKKGHKEF